MRRATDVATSVHKEVQACISFKYLFLAFRRFLSIMLPFVKFGKLKKRVKKGVGNILILFPTFVEYGVCDMSALRSLRDDFILSLPYIYIYINRRAETAIHECMHVYIFSW